MHVRAWYVLLILTYLLLCFIWLYLNKKNDDDDDDGDLSWLLVASGIFSGTSQINYKFTTAEKAMLEFYMMMMTIIIFLPTSTKPRAWKLSKNNGCDDLFGVHCVEEGDRIPPLQSYGQALKQENCFSGVQGDDCGASANLLD